MHKDEKMDMILENIVPRYNNIIPIPKWDVIAVMSFHFVACANTVVSRTNKQDKNCWNWFYLLERSSTTTKKNGGGKKWIFCSFLFGRKQLTLKGRFFNIILNNNYNKNEWKSSKWNNKIYGKDSKRCGRLCVVRFY